MKQTRSAMTMLLSAYRAVLARAFLKGLVLASALGAAAVSAADLSASISTEAKEADFDTYEELVALFPDFSSSYNIATESAADTISGDGAAYSLTVSAEHKLTIEDGDVSIIAGPTTIDGEVEIAPEAELTLFADNLLDNEDDLQRIRDLVEYAADVGSGSVMIAADGELTLLGGYYNFSDLTVENSGEINIEPGVLLIVDDEDALMDLGRVYFDSSDAMDEEDVGQILLTADSVSIGQELFGTENQGAHLYTDWIGGLHTNKLTITDSSLNTYGIEVMSDDGGVLLTVDDDKTFTLYGEGTQLGVRMGDLSLIDQNGSTMDGTLVVDQGADIYFEDWIDPEAEHSINADIELRNGSWLTFDEGGIWQAQKLTVDNGSGVDIILDSDRGDFDVSVSFTDVSVSGQVYVDSHGTLNAETFSLQGSGSAWINGTLAVSSILAVGEDTSLTVGESGTLDLGDAAQTVGLSLDENSAFTTADSYQSSAVRVDGTIEADLSNVELGEDGMTAEQADTLLAALQSGGTGLVNISGLNVNDGTKDGILTYTEDLQHRTWATETQRQTTVIDVSGPISGGWNALVLADGSTAAAVTPGYTLKLFGTTANGNFVESTDHSTAGIDIGDGGSLVLQGTGAIGVITGEKGSLTVDSGSVVNIVPTESTEDSTATAVEVRKLTVADASVRAGEGLVSASSIALQEGAELSAAAVTADWLAVSSSTLTASNLTMDEASAVYIDAGSQVTVSDTLTIGDMTVSGSSLVTAGTISVLNDSMVQVGEESSDAAESSSGSLEAGTLNLAGSTLVLDPDFGLPTALAAVERFGDALTTDGDGEESTESDLQTIDGSVIVGQNSALGVGLTLEALQAEIASYLSGGSLVEGSDYASLVVVAASGLELASGSNLLLSGTAGRDSLLDTLSSRQDNGESGIYLGEGASLIFTETALVSGEDEYTIRLAGSDAQVTAAGGQVVVPGLISRTQFNHLLTTADGNAVVSGGEVKVTTANGLFSGTIADGKTFNADVLEGTLTADTSVLSGASSAMQNYVLATAAGAWTESVTVDQSAAGAAYFSQAISNTNGAPLETAARLAVFGGAVQAAYLADQQAQGAIAARAGFNAGLNLSVAEGSGFGLWLAPVYGYIDASGFDADGVDAGAEINLYGVSLGVDYTWADIVRAGVMFSLGTGDADGKDAGSAASNDFDYYALGIYADITPVENFAVLAHVTYAEVDNDVDAWSGLSDFGKLSASTDSSALSAGVEAMYTFQTGVMDIAPHVGLRYTHLELDDYHVSSARGVILNADNDEMDIFSIPVGVRFSADYSAGDWEVSPAVDLHVTFNCGDDELDSAVSFAGISSSAALSTEVIDEVTYGVGVGISAACSAFHTGLQLGWEGSDNTDAFGVMLNAGYTF